MSSVCVRLNLGIGYERYTLIQILGGRASLSYRPNDIVGTPLLVINLCHELGLNRHSPATAGLSGFRKKEKLLKTLHGTVWFSVGSELSARTRESVHPNSK